MEVVKTYPSLEDVRAKCIIDNLNATGCSIPETARIVGMEDSAMRKYMRANGIEIIKTAVIRS